MREQIEIADDRIPGTQLIAKKNSVLLERIALEQLFSLLLGRGLINYQSTTVVDKGTAHGQLAALAEAGQVLAVRRANLGDFGFILGVFNDGSKLHTPSSL